MSHPPELEALPTTGSLVGRHLIVREIAKGVVGPLYLARTENSNQGAVAAVDTLARVIPLPADLPTRDDQFIAEAIWDSANVGHDMVLRVADVIAGKGWVTLVHDHCVGSLVSSMHRRARELGAGFPSEVAARMALDVLDGLEQSRSLCDANRIPWRAGSIAIGSLYLCGDGRTRALDGQVMAAVMRSAHMRMLSGTSSSVAPEMHYENCEPDARTDVFAVGTVLWELLTGREIVVESNASVADVVLSVPKGTLLPQGLVHALHRALELEPNRRQSTLRELAVELVMGAEKVATYEQVVEFASTLLPFETAFQPEPSLSSPAATEQAQDPSAPQSEPAAAPIHRFASPFDPTPSSAQPAPVVADDVPTVAAPVVALVVTQQSEAPEPESAQAPLSSAIADDGAAHSSLPDAVKPHGTRLEQVSWSDDEIAKVAGGTSSSAEATEPQKKSNGAKSSSAVAEDNPESIPVTSTASAAKIPAQKIPEIGAASKSVRRESTRPASKSRPSTSKPVDPNQLSGADLVAEVLRKAGKIPDPAAAKPGDGLRISMTTLILGFSTTVLAVILIMVLMQHQSTPTASTPPVAHAVQPVPAAAQPDPEADRIAAQRASSVASPKTPDANVPVGTPTETRAEPSLKPAKRSGKSSKAASGDDATADDKSKKPKTYVPNDL